MTECTSLSNIKHLEEIQKAGLETPAVNQIEVSIRRIRLEAAASDIFRVIQLQPFCQQKPIVDYCKQHGIVVQAYCPLIRGQFDNPVLQEVAKKACSPASSGSSAGI